MQDRQLCHSGGEPHNQSIVGFQTTFSTKDSRSVSDLPNTPPLNTKQTSTVMVLSPGRGTFQRSAVVFIVLIGRDNSFTQPRTRRNGSIAEKTLLISARRKRHIGGE